jgi:outer membrane protein OmpA-like peptidoglycan-associated protein/Mg-chelatase subunit ChlD
MKSAVWSSLALACATLLSSCVTGSFGEPPAVRDATPPPNYNPFFVSKTAPLPAQKPSTLRIEPGRADLQRGRTARLHLHLVDSSGTFYYGGTLSTFRTMWCKVRDSINGEVRTVKDFVIKEVSEREREPLAVALVMDHSGSMGDNRARIVQEAARAFIKRKATEDALALIRYDHRIRLDAPLTTDPDILIAALPVNGLEGFGGGTAILSGAAMGIQHLRSEGRGFQRRAVLIFTDGQENSSTITRDSLIALSLSSGIPICAVDFGNGIQPDFSRSLAMATGGAYQHIYRSQEFAPMFEDVYKRLKNSYVVEYTPEGYGVHHVTVTFCYPNDTLTSTFTFDNTPDIGSISMLNVSFETNKATLTAESRSAIDHVVRLMKVFTNMTIELRGHTDNVNKTNDPEYNNKLSQKRAEAVRDAIVKAGIDAKRVTAKGYGDTMPIAPNTDEEGRAKNRRTEFIVLTK